jgi:hypothetical protein
MTHEQIKTATLGALPNEFGVYGCEPDATARWEGKSGRDYVEAKWLWLADGRACHTVNYQLGRNYAGASGPLSVSGALEPEDARASLLKDLESAVLRARKEGIPNLRNLEDWHQEFLSTPAFFKSPFAAESTTSTLVSITPESLARDSVGAGFKPAPAEDPAVIDAEFRQVVEVAGEMDAAARAVAERLGYQLPADSTNPDLICRDIAANMRRSVEAVLEIGKGLLVLKEACSHGGFVQRLESIGIEYRLAAYFMRAAQKFSNMKSTSHLLPKIDSQTKLFELLVLDDEQIEELAETGQTGELALDDVACMGVRELRKAIRELRTKAEAKDKVIEAKEKTITALQEREAASADEKPAPQKCATEDDPIPAAIADLDHSASIAVGQMVALHGAIQAFCETLGEEYPETRVMHISTALRRVFATLADVANRYDIGLVSQTGETLIDPPDIDAAEMESMKAALAEMKAEDGDDANIIDAE